MSMLGRSNRHHVIDASTTPDNHVAGPQKYSIFLNLEYKSVTRWHELMKLKPVREPEQSDFYGIDDLVTSVQILRDDKNGVGTMLSCVIVKRQVQVVSGDELARSVQLCDKVLAIPAIWSKTQRLQADNRCIFAR